MMTVMAPEPAMTVEVVDLDAMNLLGLMVASVLRRRVQESSFSPILRFAPGSVAIRTAGMGVTLRLSHERLLIERGFDETAAARVEVDMKTLLDLSLGRVSVGKLMAGDLKLRGNVLLAGALMMVMQYG